jgi:hypothetical protein
MRPTLVVTNETTLQLIWVVARPLEHLDAGVAYVYGEEHTCLCPEDISRLLNLVKKHRASMLFSFAMLLCSLVSRSFRVLVHSNTSFSSMQLVVTINLANARVLPLLTTLIDLIQVSYRPFPWRN